MNRRRWAEPEETKVEGDGIHEMPMVPGAPSPEQIASHGLTHTPYTRTGVQRAWLPRARICHIVAFLMIQLQSRWSSWTTASSRRRPRTTSSSPSW